MIIIIFYVEIITKATRPRRKTIENKTTLEERIEESGRES